MKQQVIESLKWLAVGKVLSQAFRWGATIFTMRILFPEDYAIIAISSFFIEFLWMFSTGGILTALVRQKDLSTQVIKQFTTFSYLAHTALFLILFFMAEFIANIYGNSSLEKVIQLSSISFLISCIGLNSKALLSRELDFRSISISEATGDIICSLTTLYLAYIGLGFWAIVWGNLIKVIIENMLLIFFRPVFFFPNLINKESSPLVKFASKAAFLGTLAHIATNADIAIAGLILSDHELGIFQFAVVFAMMPMSKIMPMIRQVALPAYSKLQDEPAKLRQYFIKSQRMMMLVMIPLFWGISACSYTIIPIIFGEKWTDACLVLSVYCLSIPLKLILELVGPVFKAIGDVNTLITNTFINIAIMLPSFVIGSFWGPVGLALSWLIGFSLVFVIVSNRICTRLNISTASFYLSLAFVMTSGIIMLVSVLFTTELLENHINLLLLLACQIIVGAIAYLISLLLLDKKVLQEALNMMPTKYRKWIS